VADQADHVAPIVGLSDEVGDRLGPPQLVRGPPAGDDNGVELGGGDVQGGPVAGRGQAVLPRLLDPGVKADDGDGGSLLAQPHHGDPELEVLEPRPQQDRDPLAVQPSHEA